MIYTSNGYMWIFSSPGLVPSWYY